jgi:hypothetical protein
MTRLKKYLPHAVILTFVAFWLYLIRPAWLGQLGGTFKRREVPQEYVELKDFIHGQDEFFRTFWIPRRQRFGFYSNKHPAIDSVDLLKAASPFAVVEWLNKKGSQEKLARWGVKYVIIPFDSEGELFLEDRKYSKRERANIKKQIKNIAWLKKVESFGRIDVFKTQYYYGHFWMENGKKTTKNKEQKTKNR